MMQAAVAKDDVSDAVDAVTKAKAAEAAAEREWVIVVQAKDRALKTLLMATRTKDRTARASAEAAYNKAAVPYDAAIKPKQEALDAAKKAVADAEAHLAATELAAAATKGPYAADISKAKEEAGKGNMAAVAEAIKKADDLVRATERAHIIAIQSKDKALKPLVFALRSKDSATRAKAQADYDRAAAPLDKVIGEKAAALKDAQLFLANVKPLKK